MPFNTWIIFTVAAIVLALASSYLLWFGPAARKPFLHRVKELLHLNPEDEEENNNLVVDPQEYLSITNDDDPLENGIGEKPNQKDQET